MTAGAVNGKLTGYQALIQDATGVTELDHIQRIEDTMRNVIFHSPLDWHSREQLEQGAREALKILTFVWTTNLQPTSRAIRPGGFLLGQRK